MKPELQKKWKEKLDAAKKSAAADKRSDDSPSLNFIKKKYQDNSHEIDETPDPSLEEEIDIEVNPTNAPTEDADETIIDKKVVIKSKSKGSKGYQG